MNKPEKENTEKIPNLAESCLVCNGNIFKIGDKVRLVSRSARISPRLEALAERLPVINDTKTADCIISTIVEIHSQLIILDTIPNTNESRICRQYNNIVSIEKVDDNNSSKNSKTSIEIPADFKYADCRLCVLLNNTTFELNSMVYILIRYNYITLHHTLDGKLENVYNTTNMPVIGKLASINNKKILIDSSKIFHFQQSKISYKDIISITKLENN